jgi:hypothetical protein
MEFLCNGFLKFTNTEKMAIHFSRIFKLILQICENNLDNFFEPILKVCFRIY